MSELGTDDPREPATPPAGTPGLPPAAPAATSSVINVGAMALVVVLAAAGGPWLLGQLRSLPAGPALHERANQRVVTLEVGGMTCETCVAKVSGELGSVSGVANVDVRLDQRRAYVVCDKAVADSALLGAVGRAGPGFMAAVVAK